jgi:hypothetical protein
VGEVDQLDDAVDHRVAERYQSVDGAIGDAVDEGLQEIDRVGDGLDRQQHQSSCAEDVEAEVGDAKTAETGSPHPLQRRSP